MRFSDLDIVDELARPENEALRSSFHSRSFAAGSSIFTPGADEDLVFVVKSGRVRIYLAYEDKEFTVAILERGDIYASHTRAYAQAMTHAEILVTGTGEFRKRMAALPGFSSTMVRVLGVLLKNAFSIIDGLVFQDSSQRLASLLMHEADESLAKTGEAVARLNLTVEELAKMLGATRQTVSTLLNDMIRTGILEKQGRGIYKVLQMDRLREIANR
ncbi:Crp/Fnr family transcriptional regulator [Salidesulfovibrio brasiliensis]|uniref:Crp/Fnr family transcriptional regulator n=1 Tax=Salidesulfovibrio brasiliensis TaxID=221711 RepID=UPI0006CF469B|nr:Crp/Fnr family transcriptional regulator [Salidesulfovibrio brasiliensis]